MWKVLYLAVLMLMAIGQSCGEKLEPLEELLHVDVDELVHSHERVPGENGNEVLKESVTERDCNHHASRVQTNNFVTTIVDDYEEEMGYILTSDAPDKFFMRDVNRMPCRNGYFVTSTGHSTTSEKRYEEDGEMSPDDVPEAWREESKGRTIIKLKEKTDSDESDDSDSDDDDHWPDIFRHRCDCAYHNEVTCTKDTNCKSTCHGWWWGRHCQNLCSSTEQCHTSEQCRC